MRLAKTIALFGVACATAFGPAAAAAHAAAPEPMPVPRSWELIMEPGPLRITSVADDTGRPSLYYYMTYQVTNDTGQDVFFAPLFELGTDKGELIVSGQNVPREVTAEILRRLDNIFIEDQISIIGQLRQGQENAKDGVVIWRVGRSDVDEVSIYAVGMSGENRTLRVRDPETGELKNVVLRKTMWLRHRVLGNIAGYATGEGGRELPREQARWILRKPEASVAAARQATGQATGQASDADAAPRVAPNAPAPAGQANVAEPQANRPQTNQPRVTPPRVTQPRTNQPQQTQPQRTQPTTPPPALPPIPDDETN